MIKKNSKLIKNIRNLATLRGHKLGEFQLIPRPRPPLLDPNKLPPEVLAEMERNLEAGRIFGRIKLTEIPGNIEDYILDGQGPTEALSPRLAAECEYCGAVAITHPIDYPLGAGEAMEKDCPSKARPKPTS